MKVLQDPRVVKISVANPDTAPYGRAAINAMKHAGMEAGVASKLVRGENVSLAAQFVQSGAAQIGLVAYSLTFVPPMKDSGDVWLVPEAAHETLEQGGVILPWCKERAAAEALRDFLLGPEGQAILKKHGFESP